MEREKKRIPYTLCSANLYKLNTYKSAAAIQAARGNERELLVSWLKTNMKNPDFWRNAHVNMRCDMNERASSARPDESISVIRPFFTSGGGFSSEKTRRRPNQWWMTKLRLLTDACIIRRGGFVESLGTRGSQCGQIQSFYFCKPAAARSFNGESTRRAPIHRLYFCEHVADMSHTICSHLWQHKSLFSGL
jgi:hypothetical protein